MTIEQKLDILEKLYFEETGRYMDMWEKEYLCRYLTADAEKRLECKDCQDCQDA